MEYTASLLSDSERETSEDEQTQPKSQTLQVALVFVLYVVTRSSATVLIYRVQKAMSAYTTILMSIYWPIGILSTCFLLLFLVKLCESRTFELDWFSPWSRQASVEGPVPQHWFILLGFLNQLCATSMAPSLPFVPVVLQTPLGKLDVLWTAILSSFYLKTQFKMVHWAGISLILYSCFVGVMVELQGPPSVICQGLKTATETLQDVAMEGLLISKEATWIVNNATSNCVEMGLPPYKDSSGEIVHFSFGVLASMYMLFIVSHVPFAFLNVCKQKKLKQLNLDVAYGYFWQCVWQVPWGMVFIPASWIPWPTPSGHNEASFSTFGQDLADSWTCFMGQNPKPQIVSCSAEPVCHWWAIYLFFNVSCNLCLTWLIKHLSSTWASAVAILCGNLGGFFSQFEIIGGKSAQILSMEQWMALVLSSVAMWIYNVQDEEDVRGQSVYRKK